MKEQDYGPSPNFVVVPESVNVTTTKSILTFPNYEDLDLCSPNFIPKSRGTADILECTENEVNVGQVRQSLSRDQVKIQYNRSQECEADTFALCKDAPGPLDDEEHQTCNVCNSTATHGEICELYKANYECISALAIQVLKSFLNIEKGAPRCKHLPLILILVGGMVSTCHGSLYFEIDTQNASTTSLICRYGNDTEGRYIDVFRNGRQCLTAAFGACAEVVNQGCHCEDEMAMNEVRFTIDLQENDTLNCKVLNGVSEEKTVKVASNRKEREAPEVTSPTELSTKVSSPTESSTEIKGTQGSGSDTANTLSNIEGTLITTLAVTILNLICCLVVVVHICFPRLSNRIMSGLRLWQMRQEHFKDMENRIIIFGLRHYSLHPGLSNNAQDRNTSRISLPVLFEDMLIRHPELFEDLQTTHPEMLNDM